MLLQKIGEWSDFEYMLGWTDKKQGKHMLFINDPLYVLPAQIKIISASTTGSDNIENEIFKGKIGFLYRFADKCFLLSDKIYWLTDVSFIILDPVLQEAMDIPISKELTLCDLSINESANS